MSTPTTILIATASPHDHLLLRRLLSQIPERSYIFYEASLAEPALALIAATPIDCMLLDPDLPDCGGLEVLAQLGGDTGGLTAVPVVICAGLDDAPLAAQSLQAGAMDYLNTQHLTGPSLARAIAGAIHHHRLRRRLHERQRHLETHTLQLEQRVAMLQTRLDEELGRAELRAALEREIDERMQVEATLRASERHFATIFEASPVGIAITRLRDSRVEDANPAMLTMLGYTLDEVLGHTVHDLGIWQTWEDRTRLVELILQAGRIAGVEATWRRRSGAPCIVLLSAELIALNGETCTLIQATDITERKCSEEQLRQSEVRFRALIEHAPGALTLLGTDGKLSFISASTERVMGYSPAEFTGTDPAALTHPDDLPALLGLLSELMASPGMVRTTHYRFRHHDGSWRWVESTISNLLHEPSVGAVAINYQDITERKQTELALRELNQTLEERVRQRTAEVQDLYERAPTGYHSLDGRGTFIRVNQTMLDWLGYTREELIGRSFADIVTPAGKEQFYFVFPTFKVQGKVDDLVFDLVRKDGSTFPVLLSATALYNDAGAYVMSRSTTFDITQRKVAETALRESEGQNRLLFEASPEAIALFDGRSTIVRANNAFEQITGCTGERLARRRLDELGLLAEQDRAQLAAALEQARQIGSFATVEFRLTSATGERRDVAARIFGLLIHGDPHFLTALRDITAEKQAATALRQANAELARAARAKDEFLATMSHELRTPLNAILGFSESLQEEIYGPLNVKQAASISHIASSGSHLLALINDILDLSKAEASRLDLKREPVHVAEICQASLLFVKEQALKKELRLKLQKVDLVLDADPLRLKQMLVNLLSNAVKFTPMGGEVYLETKADPEAGVAHLIVHDTGIGIAPEDLGRLFQPFSQLDNSLNRQHEGTGLGLALVRRLAELHGGSCTATSEAGVGSHFTITLPLAGPQVNAAYTATAHQVEAPPESSGLHLPLASPPPEGAGWRVLLAEDNESNIQLVSEYLQVLGYSVVAARNGQEALERAQRMGPDLIVIDIQMPLLDGLEAIRRMRAAGLTRTPIIALTALAMQGDRERCLEAGADEYLTKPVSLRNLREAVRRLLA